MGPGGRPVCRTPLLLREPLGAARLPAWHRRHGPEALTGPRRLPGARTRGPDLGPAALAALAALEALAVTVLLRVSGPWVRSDVM